MLSEILFFAIQADEVTDLTSKCVSIPWDSKEYEILEEQVGLVKLTKSDAATIFAALKDVLLRSILPVNTCRGQALYDGAANMSGHLSGVASCFTVEHPAAPYVHCFAHSLNLCLQDAPRSCTPTCDSLELVIEIVKLIKFRPKHTFFNRTKSQLSPDTQNLKYYRPTKWTVRTDAIKAILDN